ncbi:hypothetical protein PDE_02058 [Penicillium oxalicum 114-2]|uniref:Uncharacterized protein n=1 Tax=Penicillium oxalicum (strain 114-2 / CGMCC 5302) TaxID=933388 RepID=S8AYQ8_PENO1|nr:hypothetical protein PDE_02058 [Penicillium oxalicum 114-2]
MNTTLNSFQPSSQSSSASSTFPSASNSGGLSSSNTFGVVTQQPPPPYHSSHLPADLAVPAGATSLQQPPASAYLAQPAMAQTQPLTQNFSNLAGAPGLPAMSQPVELDPRLPAEAPSSTHQPAAGHYPHQVSGSGGPTATAPFLQDFSLVAEAAKRAQLSIVMRDLESVTL